MQDDERWRRRDVLGWAAAAAAGQLLPSDAWGSARPAALGVMSGDPSFDGQLVWAQTDRPARMWVEWSERASFKGARRVRGQDALSATGYAAKTMLRGLPPGRPVYCRVVFEDLADLRTLSAPAECRLVTPSRAPRDVHIGWGGDVAGQGYGIDTSRGGYLTFLAMKEKAFDVFIHSGDHVYADIPLPESFALADGSTWKNIVTPAKSKVAETLEEYRGQYAYNLLDTHFRAFFSQTPVIAQWDDHETLNNWYPSERIDDARYETASVDLLAARAERAFRDAMPLAPKLGPGFYRWVRLGPLIDVFVLDARTFRGPNGANQEPAPGPSSAFYGADQVSWLKRALSASRATWKIIATNMPLGLVVGDGPSLHEAMANGRPELLGREHELADILRFAQARKVANLLFVTADVHYAAAHHYHPDRARFTQFDPFWELVAGPLHAGTFGPNPLDPTFGPEPVFVARTQGAKMNLPPSEGEQWFGGLRVDAKTRLLEVSLYDRTGKVVFRRNLAPA